MKNKHMKGFLILITLTLLIPTIATAINLNPGQHHIQLGTIEYNPNTPATKSITLTNSTTPITLTLINTDNLPANSITIISNYHNPSLNETKLVFQTPYIEAPYHFNTSTLRTIVYQDEHGRLYTINIDYTKLPLPPDPIEALQQQITQLENNASTYKTQYENTITQLNNTQHELTNLEQDYDKLLTEKNNKTTQLNTLKNKISILENESLNHSQNASHYKANYENAIQKLYGDYTSQSEIDRAFHHYPEQYANGGIYGNMLEAEQNAQDTTNTSILIISAIFILFLIIAYYLHTTHRPQPTLTAIERDTQYGEKQYFIDNIISKGKQWADTLLHRNTTEEKPKEDIHQNPTITSSQKDNPGLKKLETRIDSCETIAEMHTRDLRDHASQIKTLNTKYEEISKKVDEKLTSKNKKKKD